MRWAAIRAGSAASALYRLAIVVWIIVLALVLCMDTAG